MRTYDDSHKYEFTAKILCVSEDSCGKYAVLDNTFFFPEGGGQDGDSGEIGGVICTGTKEADGEVRHYITDSLTEGAEVNCVIDRNVRFRRMQNHSGEHVVSGIIHNLYGYNNVGFHLGDDDVTCDFDGELTKENIATVEQMANAIVFADKKVNIFYPSEEELETLVYRSKIELSGDVRIVEIEGVDKCACCAPHVSTTGEIGLIKIINPEKWKKGTRVHLRCGYDALYDYDSRYQQSQIISARLKVPQEDIAAGVERVYNESLEKDRTISELKKKIAEGIISSLKQTEGNMAVFADDADTESLTAIVNAGALLCTGVCFALTPVAGVYRFSAKSAKGGMKQFLNDMRQKLNVRGGGTDEFANGSIDASKEEIEKYLGGNA